MGDKIKQYNKKGLFLSVWKNQGLSIDIQRLYTSKDKSPKFARCFRTSDINDLIDLLTEVREDLKNNPIYRDLFLLHNNWC